MPTIGDILVVDDEIHIADLIAEILREEGYSVRHAPDGKNALTQLQTSIPALILLDMSMPDMIGTTLLHHIRNALAIQSPVVIMTAGTHSIESLIAQGATDYLAKPFELEQLLNCVARYVVPT